MSDSSDTVPNWNPNTVYSTPGTEVSEDGVIYENRWWTQGDDPLSSTAASAYGPWAAVGTPTVPAAPSAPPSHPVAPQPVAPQPAAPQPTTPNTPPEGAGKSFSPYVDMGLVADQNLLGLAQATGLRDFTLAFVQSSGSGTIGWAGNGSIDDDTFAGNPSLQSQVHTLQAEGGTITISIGGAAGTDPAMATNSAKQLQAEYQSIIDRYGVTHLDFDVEGAALGDQTSIDLRDKALVGLEKANPGLHVSFTLPVAPTGLGANGVDVLSSAAGAGVGIDTVNIMAMDYGGPAVDDDGAMGDDAIAAAKATESQIQAAGLTAKVGMTPMIGVNDVGSETFSLADAQQVESFAAATDWVAGLGMWSIARDNGSAAGDASASATGSGVSQTPYQFSSVFSHVGDGVMTASEGPTHEAIYDAQGASAPFVFSPGPGHELITGFQVSGADHGIISLPNSDAGRLADILAQATASQGDTILHLGHDATITFAGISPAQLQKNSGDFVFHS